MAASNINRWIGTGNLTRDPELKTMPSGTSVANLRIAVNGRVKRENDWADKANYFDVVVFGARADNVGRYLVKGSAIAVDGRLEYQEWETQDGNKRSRVVIIADNVQFLTKRDSGGGDVETHAGTSAPVAASASDEDIPF